jgi:hypothetical protein
MYILEGIKRLHRIPVIRLNLNTLIIDFRLIFCFGLYYTYKKFSGLVPPSILWRQSGIFCIDLRINVAGTEERYVCLEHISKAPLKLRLRNDVVEMYFNEMS